MYSAFMELCENKDFDIPTARKVLELIDLSKEFKHPPRYKDTIYSSMRFTPLSMAIFYNNLKMVQLLLSAGADPNVVYDGHQSVLWDLQYNDGETHAENENRLLMAKCLLENGADPMIVVEGEDLYHYVLSCSQDDIGDLADYRAKFLDLLEEYIEDYAEDNPLQILRDALEMRGMDLEHIILVAAGLEHPLSMLDMADWVVDHPQATWQELMAKKGALIKKYMIGRM